MWSATGRSGSQPPVGPYGLRPPLSNTCPSAASRSQVRAASELVRAPATTTECCERASSTAVLPSNGPRMSRQEFECPRPARPPDVRDQAHAREVDDAHQPSRSVSDYSGSLHAQYYDLVTSAEGRETELAHDRRRDHEHDGLFPRAHALRLPVKTALPAVMGSGPRRSVAR